MSAPLSGNKRKRPDGAEDDNEGAASASSSHAREAGSTALKKLVHDLLRYCASPESASRGYIIDVKEAAERLHVEKRKLYYITPVLEELRILSKCGISKFEFHGTKELARALKDMRVSSGQIGGTTAMRAVRMHSHTLVVRATPPAPRSVLHRCRMPSWRPLASTTRSSATTHCTSSRRRLSATLAGILPCRLPMQLPGRWLQCT